MKRAQIVARSCTPIFGGRARDRRTRQHAARRPGRRHGAVHRLGRAVRDHGADGLRQPRPRRLCHDRRLCHRAGDEPAGRAVRRGAGARLHRHRRHQRGVRAPALYAALSRRRTRPGAVHHRPGLRDDRRGDADGRAGNAAAEPAAVDAGPAQPRLHGLPHLQHRADRGRRRHHARALARLRAHPHGRADPRRGRQPAHGGIARHQHHAAVHHHLRLRQRHGGARRRARRRVPRPRPAISAEISGDVPDRRRGRRPRPHHRRVLRVADHRRARLHAEEIFAAGRHGVHLRHDDPAAAVAAAGPVRTRRHER